MKYKSEIGESMVKPNKKLKKILFIMGITGAVYVCFQYLLPLIIPFLVAYGIALMLRPSAGWISRKCRISIFGRHVGIPIGVAGAVELILLMVLLGLGLYMGGKKLYQEASMLIDQIPVWMETLDCWLTQVCHNMETLLSLEDGYMVLIVRDMLRDMISSVKSTAMPYLVINSMTILQWFIKITVIWVILVIAVMLWLQELEAWKKRRESSAFRQEFARISQLLLLVCDAFLKTQGVIMLLTMSVCTIGFWLMKNPYYILTGIGLGLLDALPIFGTGTVLIPWSLLALVRGDYGEGAFILGLYIVCYLLRQTMEAKMMGDKVGLTPIETLMSMYIGLQLFGLLGFLLGPIGLLLIEDIVESIE